MSLIGRVIATEKMPTTIDSFCFWTSEELILNPFDVVRVDHVNNSKTFAVIEEISHITDSASFLSNFISNDFGDVNSDEQTLRIRMNYVKANVVSNDKGINIPVHSGERVYLADKNEVEAALGLGDNIKNPIVCGYIEMYESAGEDKKVTIPVNVDSRYLIGPDGAHLNISGISGLASKTSYAMFLMKAIQDKYLNNADIDIEEDDIEESVAFVVFNVKGRDLLAIDEPSSFDGKPDKETKIKDIYESILGLSTKPFKQVKYLYPYANSSKPISYVPQELFEKQKSLNTAKQYKFSYTKDKNSIDLMFAEIDDSTQTMESIITQITDGHNGFDSISTWQSFLDKIQTESENTKSSGSKGNNEILVSSWKKFNRLIKKSIYKNPLFGDINENNGETRIADEIQKIQKNDVYVIDIAKLNSDMQSFVFGSTVRQILDFQLGDKEYDDGNCPPSKIIVFIDEMNKFASKETPKSSPILKEILDIAERGRSLGVILFAAEQFKSNIHKRVSGNCSTFAYGRTNAIEVAENDYTYIPKVYKTMMTRLKQGEYIIQNPIFRSLLNIKFPEPIYKQFK